MNEEHFNQSLRVFLKNVGVRSQREIEQAVDRARASGKLQGNEQFPAEMQLEIPALGLSVRFEHTLELE
jgi:hypothetical protein